MPWNFYDGSGNLLLSFDNIAVSQLANGTDGELITWDAAGAPTTVATGTSGQVLTSNGAGTAPTFQAAGSGLANVVEDTTPQLGGNLDMQANLLVGNGGSTGIAISANGEVNMAAQPSVAAYNSATDSNVTGNNTEATVDFDTEIYDQNADFASDTFTAPVTGRYLVIAGLRYSGTTASGTYNQAKINSSNRSWTQMQDIVGAADAPGISVAAIIDMDAADTLTIAMQAVGESSDVVDISGSGAPDTYVSVQLIA